MTRRRFNLLQYLRSRHSGSLVAAGVFTVSACLSSANAQTSGQDSLRDFLQSGNASQSQSSAAIVTQAGAGWSSPQWQDPAKSQGESRASFDQPLIREISKWDVHNLPASQRLIDDSMVRQVAYRLSKRQDDTQLPGQGQEQNQLQIQEQLQEQLSLKGNVTIVQDPVTGFYHIRGEHQEDVDKVLAFFQEINDQAASQRKQPEVINLNYVQASSIQPSVQQVYDSVYAGPLGSAEIRANPVNNTLIVVGFPGANEQIKKLVEQFDQPSADGGEQNFKAIRLKYLTSTDAVNRVETYFGQRNLVQGTDRLPSIPVITIPDYRSNIIIIKGSAQSIAEAERFLAEIDIDDLESAHEVKIVPVRNRLAADLAMLVQDAINGNQPNAARGFYGTQNQQQLQQFNQQQQQQQNQGDNNRSTIGAKALSMKAIGENGDVVSSGILFDARVSADVQTNSIIITAPPKSIKLIETLIQELDNVPDVEVQMKVFQILNGDATQLATTLQTLFAAQAQQQGGFGGFGGFGQQQSNLFNQLPLQTAGATPGSNLVNLRFAVDSRTNSIIVTGPVGELQVVEALLNRLDEDRSNGLITRVYRLSNASALDVSEALNAWITSRDTIFSSDPRTAPAINQISRRVTVGVEVASNSLIVQASPQYMEEAFEIIIALDRRPPMVKVDVMMAEVDLNRLEEFGMDIGIQDSILFDRGTSLGAGNAIGAGTGFLFNQAAAPNLNAYARENMAGQALSNLGTGRVNNNVGYGGLVLSAGNESISFLLRALQNKQCARVLNKPTITTMENLQGRVHIGASVPRVAGSTVSGLNVVQNVEFQDVGVTLEVTPRVSPDGTIAMAVNIIKSSVGLEATGITVGVGADGTPIRAPSIFITQAQSTLLSRSGQTVVFAGLIEESKNHETRGIPIMSDLPVVGPLFRFESDAARRTELLIFLTPHLLTDDDDVDLHNQREFERMHWCLEDVAEMYGSTGFHRFQGNESATETIYPDVDPIGSGNAPGRTETHPATNFGQLTTER